MELAKRRMENKQEQISQQKAEISQNPLRTNNINKQMEEEKKRIQQRKKKKVVRQKKSGFGAFFKGWFN